MRRGSHEETREDGSVRDWVVGGALIVGDDGSLLLVQNRRRNGSHDWTPPGGVIDEGETLIDGLTREVEEETGLRVTEWAGPVYEVRCDAPDLGWRLRVEAHVAVAYEGDLHVDDPDGIVVDARFVQVDACHEHLSGGHPWVCEPLADWLAEQWPHHEARPYGFTVTGADPASLTVTRRS
jgi:8-oxo-dGTP diphosphatase